MVLKGYFIQYKFIIPPSLKHSSYTYQKLFRALYGYSQTVSKSNGKTYKYHRAGVLSQVPYIRPGKNCVIIPQGVFQQLLGFFKTGKNPGHYWHVKGDWKAVYYMDEKDLKQEEIVDALEKLVDRTYVLTPSKEHEKLVLELENLKARVSQNQTIDTGHKAALLTHAQSIVSLPWFKNTHQRSNSLKKLNSLYEDLRNK